MFDVTVIGGGIVGAAASYHLARAGMETLLIDRRDEGRATDAGAGIVAPAISRHADSAWYEFAVKAAQYYPDLADTLKDAGQSEIGYGEPGVLLIDQPATPTDRFETARDRILSRQARVKHPPAGELSEISGERATELFPALTDVRRGIYYETGIRVEGRRFENALTTAGQAAGLELRETSANHLIIENNAVTGIRTTTGTIESNNVVIAGGAWSGAFGEQLNLRLPIEPQRGQIVHLTMHETNTASWPIISTLEGHYLVPWPEQRVACGATRETGVGFNPYPTAGGIREVLQQALTTAPGLEPGELTDIRVGLRPRCEDGLPVIGEIPEIEGAYVATGHGPTGLTLGPYTGRIVADLVQDNQVDVDISSFSPTRFTPSHDPTP